MAKRIIYFIVVLLFGCNYSNTTDYGSKYHEGRTLYEEKCFSCHSFLTVEGLGQTSLGQMRQLPFDSLYAQIMKIQCDTNHKKPPLNIDNIGIDEIKKIVFYVIETGKPKYN
jgi:uncharacterized membrane protein